MKAAPPSKVVGFALRCETCGDRFCVWTTVMDWGIVPFSSYVEITKYRARREANRIADEHHAKEHGA